MKAYNEFPHSTGRALLSCVIPASEQMAPGYFGNTLSQNAGSEQTAPEHYGNTL